MLRKTLLTTVFISSFFQFEAQGTFIPEEDIKITNRIFSERDANMTEAEFNGVIEKARLYYTPIVSAHGGKLDIIGAWTDDTLNASASQFFGTWRVNMYGGLARHPEMTLDGFAMVLCHEIGHHLAGFSFTKSMFGGVWAANEGQSDYFAAHSCARELWGPEVEVNATFREPANELVKQRCDLAWQNEDEQNLCYRINAAGESLARVLSSLKKDETFPQYDTPDANKVGQTDNRHPQAQCRLDTTFSASVCQADFNTSIIPGKKATDPYGPDAEKEASENSCMEISGYTEGLRPRCWFSPGV